MNNKFLAASFLILSIFILSGCKTADTKAGSSVSGEAKTSKEVLKADKLQIFTFHTTNRCATCIAIGRLSKETVEEYYQPELRDGIIEIGEINIDLPENKELADKFQASGSALFVNAIYDNQDHISEDVTVWRLTSNESQFKSYLKNKIDVFLKK